MFRPAHPAVLGRAYQSKGREQDQRHTDDVDRDVNTVMMVGTVLEPDGQ